MRALAIGLIIAALGSALVAAAHEDMDLPAGPVRDRHELMEGVGKNAKIIGDAMKAGTFDKIPAPAGAIAEAAKNVPALFPEGSTHPKSRAKPEIWTDPGGFAADTKRLEETAAALAKAATEQKDVPKAANEMFGACKSCHDKFRVPEE
jgi:cytochrome c556